MRYGHEKKSIYRYARVITGIVDGTLSHPVIENKTEDDYKKALEHLKEAHKILTDHKV